jgi:hypothetical protein
MQKQANSVNSGSESASAWHRPANWEAKVCGDHVVLTIGIWCCINAAKELWYNGARRDLVRQATGLGVADTLGSGGGLGSGVVLGPLGEATLSKTSLVGVACWRGATCAHGAGVLGTEAGNRGGDHVVALGASLSSSFAWA